MTDFSQTRSLFDMPPGIIYLDGNSLGPLPVAAKQRLAHCVTDEWGQMLIGGWNRARWYQAPLDLGDRLGRLIGAEPGTCVVGDTLSLQMYQCVGAALGLQKQRHPAKRVVLSDQGNFPTDLYMIQGLVRQLGDGYELKLVAPDAVKEHLDDQVAVLMLTHADYRTGRLHDMAHLTRRAHSVGALTVWDLAHSAGAMACDVGACDVDFAAGCTYKYLNAGPGAPAFMYCAPKWIDQAQPPLQGWMGHSAPFAFETRYQAADGISKFRIGTPPVLQLAALDAALDAFDGVDLDALRAQSVRLSQLFIDGVDACQQLELASPADPDQRGSQVSFRAAPGSGVDAYGVVQALIARGVIGDFRAPDLMRFGFTPLYLSKAQVIQAVAHLADILETQAWNQPRFTTRHQVT